MDPIPLADAEARPGERLDHAKAGDQVTITRHGKPVARLTPATPPRQPIDLATLQALTATMPFQEQGAADLVRRMRDDDRY